MTTFERQLVADALPAYDIGDVLGQGGFGVVVSARHRQLDRSVAIKQLPATFATDVAMRRRFTAEARVLASLDHPHVVPVYDFVEREDLCLIVMELLPGGTLRSRAATDEFTAVQAVALSLACAAGLNAAHERGVLHRDVKPENMLFTANGILKVADFGIAKVAGSTGTMLTRTGEVIGTPAYIAPEQVRGEPLSPATDVYALATMLYQLLSGDLPFPADGDPLALLFQHAHETPRRLEDVAGDVPRPVAAAVMRGLATEPRDRFPTAESFGVALAEAGTRAWGPGWLFRDGVPVPLGAERVVAAARGAAVPLGGVPSQRNDPAGARPPADGGPAAPSGSLRGRAPATARWGTARAPESETPGADAQDPPAAVPLPASAEPDASEGTDRRSPADKAGPSARAVESARPGRRRLVIAAVVLAVLLAAIAAVLLAPRLFAVYQ